MTFRRDLLPAIALVCCVASGCARSASRDTGTSQQTSATQADGAGLPTKQTDAAANGGVSLRSANPPHSIAEDAPTVTRNTPATGGAAAMQAIPCATRDVKLSVDGANGDFNGMSHSGTYLMLTNKSRTACSVPGLPQLTFLDANGPTDTTADLPGAKFVHPGPVVLPIVLQPGKGVKTSARWVSGPVYTDNLCYHLTGVSLALRNSSAATALSGQMCGERGKGVHYDLQRYGAQ